jgi:hypothetical protein
LGYAFYDTELISAVAKESGLSENYVAGEEEYAHHASKFLNALELGVGYDLFGGMSLSNQLQIAQTKVILRLAEEGNCVILGRCSDYILRNYPNALHVFIHASDEFRVNRVQTHYDDEFRKENPEKRLHDKDLKRQNYYKACTSEDWGDARNYDLSLSTSKLGIDTCVDLIVGLAKKD